MMKFVMRYGIFIAKKKYAWKDCAETEAIQMRNQKLMDNQLPEEVFEERCDFQLYNDEDVAHTYLQIERKMRTYYESL